MTELRVPFFRVDLGQEEIDEVVATLRSGWLTTGPRTQRFEIDFATAVDARHALAVNSCTAALHLAVEALGLRQGQAVLVPTMTFAATAEVVRYQGAMPVLVDCDPQTLNFDLVDAQRKIESIRRGDILAPEGGEVRLVGLIPVHVGGLMCDMGRVHRLAADHQLWVVEDAAHAFPAAWRQGPEEDWRRCGQGSADVTCFSFYANKTITTGEGGMAVTGSAELAERMRLMALHGLSKDAWRRHEGVGSWDYRIAAPGFKYNMTDIAAAIGLHQLQRAEDLRRKRLRIADLYRRDLGKLEAIECPPSPDDFRHAWHVFPVKLCLDRLRIDRDRFIEELGKAGIGSSVHWRPLHLHPYYQETYSWGENDFPVADRVWQRIVTLPLFPTMTDWELDCVVETVSSLCDRFAA